jgi:hypothetical protein
VINQNSLTIEKIITSLNDNAICWRYNFWPIGAGMSRPECGARSSLLKKRLRPNELLNLPAVGGIKLGNLVQWL